ncbi:uncharacterized protein LOC143573617 [Bidens hawaiensis]|uniref:uncharacterized protein LOC143573617 n=1 Tax=Bidens hawaiensis TaxID=980011 RepID=UPI00404B2050
MADYDSTKPTNPFTSVISKFTNLLANFRFPPPPVKVETEAGKTVVRGGELAEEEKPVTVRFGEPRPTTVAPLKLEAKGVDKETKPAVLWQVYAIGGFFILKWALAKWNERRTNNQSADEEDSPPQPAAADEGNK